MDTQGPRTLCFNGIALFQALHICSRCLSLFKFIGILFQLSNSGTITPLLIQITGSISLKKYIGSKSIFYTGVQLQGCLCLTVYWGSNKYLYIMAWSWVWATLCSFIVQNSSNSLNCLLQLCVTCYNDLKTSHALVKIIFMKLTCWVTPWTHRVPHLRSCM